MKNISGGEICLFPYKWFEVNDIRINFNSTYEEVHKLPLFSKEGLPSCFSKSEIDEPSDFSEYAGSIKFIYNEQKLKSSIRKRGSSFVEAQPTKWNGTGGAADKTA